MEKFWLKQYPTGVPAEIDLNTYTSLVDYLKQCCTRFSDKPAFVNMGGVLSYQQLWDLSDRMAAYLQSLGVQKGDRVALMMPNLLQYPVALFAVLKLGAVVVNVNPLYTTRELAHVLKDSGAKAIVVLSNFAHTVSEVLMTEPVALKHIIVTEAGDLLPFPKNKIVNFVLHYVKRVVPAYRFDTEHIFKKIMKSEKFLQAVSLSHEDIAFLQYTGGTTGVSKGAMLTHGNMVANVLQVGAWIRPFVNDAKEAVITALPLYHIFALTANCLLFMGVGAKNVFITNPRDLPGLIKELSKHPFSVFLGVNTLFNGLVNHPDFAKLDFSHLKFSLGGGMAVQPVVAEKWHQITGCVMLQGYGLTEASPVISVGPLHAVSFSNSVGFPLPSTEIKILGSEGQELPLGQTGEIAVRGPQVMRGYWGDEMKNETAKVLIGEGWLLTGDCGDLDRDGRLILRDRKKDLIVVSGFKVFPTEVEAVLAHCPGVLEAAVVGVMDDQHNESVKAFIVRKDPQLSAETVLTYCHHELTPYKVPKIIEFRDSLPKSNIGKILRKDLR